MQLAADSKHGYNNKERRTEPNRKDWVEDMALYRLLAPLAMPVREATLWNHGIGKCIEKHYNLPNCQLDRVWGKAPATIVFIRIVRKYRAYT